VQSFMGFANFFRRFIKRFSKIAKPLTDLTKKGIKGNWTNACQAAFDELKRAFTTGPILTHFDETRPTKLETDASDFAPGAVLSQVCEDQRWHPVAFYSRRFAPAEVNYHVPDKEMTAIVAAYREWEYMLRSVKEKITVYTDHKKLENFNTTTILNRRQHRWAEFLQLFNFKVVYREGRRNEKAAALSRRRDYRPEGGSNSDPYTFFRPHQYVGQEQDILRPQMLQCCQGFRLHSAFRAALLKAADQDQSYLDTFKSVLKGEKNVYTSLTIIKELLCYKNRWYIPKEEALKRIIKEAEDDSRMARHFGTYKTIGRGRANFYWPKMDEQITEYICTCNICQHNKVMRHKKYGLLEPIDVRMRPGTSISMDFIVGLPKSEGYTKICVIVDRFSKMAHFIPLKTEEHIKELALIFLKEIWRLHGLPETIISDRDTQFTSKFWISLMQLLQVKLNVSTAFHPETDRETERVNQTLEQYLRSYCSYQQDDLVLLLPFAKHGYNILLSESAKASPFAINYGFTPLTQWSGMVSDNQGIHPDSELVVKDLERTWQEIRETLQREQERQRKWDDQKRQPSPEYITLEDVSQGRAKKADRVMLNRKNLRTRRPVEKLDHKIFGPFVIKQKIGSRAYELELPARWTIHPVFKVGLLEPYREDPIGRPQLAIPAPDIVDSEPSYVVAEVVDSRWYGNPKLKFPHSFVQYLVGWEGYEPEENSWKPFGMLEDCPMQTLVNFNDRYPSKPRDHRVVNGPMRGKQRRR